ncbi:MAG: PilN domain-containing protein [Pseudomonadales bacterium]|nr:PilN domain-containing protein [Pseudomonadales bacterium]
MAKINLLPWREARREQLKQEFLGNLGSVVIAAGLLIGAVYFAINGEIDAQNNRNAYMQKNIDSLNEEVREIDALKSKREQLIDRMNIIQGLQGNRPVIVRIFDQFVRTLPDGVYYQRLQREDQRLTIDGTAESNNRVSNLMRRLDGSNWFADPNLTAVVANPTFGEQANNFSLAVTLAKATSIADAGGSK